MALVQVSKPLGSERDLPPELKAILKKVKDCKDLAEKQQRVYRDRWDEIYGLYRNYKRLVNNYSSADSENDRHETLATAKREWGAELFIPYCFATVETIVPRVLSNDPHMLVRPRTPDARYSAIAVEEAINAAQAEIAYDLKLQPTARRGFKYGLGVQKTFWHKQARRVVRPFPSASGSGYAVKRGPDGEAALTEVVAYEGPDVEDVDIWDFFWDPAAKSIETCEWVLHRTWRPLDYIKRKSESGDWFPLDIEKVKGMGSERGRGEVWAGRMEAAGHTDFDPKGNDLHEVWEYHNRENVYTVLDATLVVQADVTPFFHRELPFQIFRPTPVEGEFVGIGEIEPIAALQYELNTLRQQRRDNATMALMRAFLYREGRVDPNTLKIGPGLGIPVQGSPRDDIVPLTFGDLPASSYQEEQAIKDDMERTSGISDAVAGGAGEGTASSETATGIQLVQQAANVRIRLKTKNLERETIRPAARQFLELMRQHIIVPRDVRIPDQGTPEGYRFQELGPDQLLDHIDDPIPDAGSTEPENKVEREQRATSMLTAFQGDPDIDQRKLKLHYLKENDVRDAENFLADETPSVNPVLVGAGLLEEGVDPEIIHSVLEAAQAAEADADAEEQGAPSQNGAAPAPQEA